MSIDRYIKAVSAFCLPLLLISTAAAGPSVGIDTLRSAMAEAEAVGSWERRSGKDDLDDKTIIQIVLGATQTEVSPQRRPVDRSKQANIVITCRKGQTQFQIGVDNTLVADHALRVSYRLDDNKPITGQRWERSIDSTFAGHWSSKPSIEMINRLMSSERMLVRFENNVFGQMESRFELKGLKAAIKPVREACKW